MKTVLKALLAALFFFDISLGAGPDRLTYAQPRLTLEPDAKPIYMCQLNGREHIPDCNFAHHPSGNSTALFITGNIQEQFAPLPTGLHTLYPQLKTIVITGTDLKELPQDFGATMGHLTHLDLSNNGHLTTLPPTFATDFTALTHLYLAGTSITTYPQGFGNGMKHIRVITVDQGVLNALPAALKVLQDRGVTIAPQTDPLSSPAQLLEGQKQSSAP